MNASVEVARMETELRAYRIQVDNAEQLISLLKAQNAQQAREIETMSTECAEKVRRLSQERDEAVRKATEVSGILHQTADSIMGGLRKMKGDETPQPLEIVKPNLTTVGKLSPPEDDEEIRDILTRLPRNEMNA